MATHANLKQKTMFNAIFLSFFICCTTDVLGSFTLCSGETERAEYHVMSHPQTFPRGLAPDYRAVGTTLGRRGKTLFTPQVFLAPSRPPHRATAVFGHAGGRLVVPNTGEPTALRTEILSGTTERCCISRLFNLVSGSVQSVNAAMPLIESNTNMKFYLK